MKTATLNRGDGKKILENALKLLAILGWFGLKLPHYHVLLLAEEYPNILPGTITTKTDALGAQTSRILGYIEEIGLVQRSFGSDRRTSPVNLTEKGAELLAGIDKRLGEYEDEGED